MYARAQEVLNVAAASADLPAPTPYDLDEHHALATRIASEAITLLRNEDDALPLSSGTNVALIGDLADTPRYQGAGSSQVNPTRLEAPRELLEAGGESARGLVLTGYAPGYERHGGTSDALIAEPDMSVTVARVTRSLPRPWRSRRAPTLRSCTWVSTNSPSRRDWTGPTCAYPRGRIDSLRQSWLPTRVPLSF